MSTEGGWTQKWTLGAFGWAFAEATFFFVLPDFFLVPAVVARPELAWRLVVSTFTGSLLGVLALAGLTTLAPLATRDMIEWLPFTHPAMFDLVASRIGDVSAVLAQPVSGIPAKVWTWVQVQQGTLPFVVFLAVLWAGRTLRFVAVTLVALVIARVAGPVLRRWWFVALGVYAATFFAALIALTGV